MLLASRRYNENLKESHAGQLLILCLNGVILLVCLLLLLCILPHASPVICHSQIVLLQHQIIVKHTTSCTSLHSNQDTFRYHTRHVHDALPLVLLQSRGVCLHVINVDAFPRHADVSA